MEPCEKTETRLDEQGRVGLYLHPATTSPLRWELSKRNKEAQLKTLMISDISDVGKSMLGRVPLGRSLTTPY